MACFTSIDEASSGLFVSRIEVQLVDILPLTQQNHIVM
jgi:hypothetical protein